MERNEHYYDRNYNNQSDNYGSTNQDRYSERYGNRGNYYGMRDTDNYRNVHMQQRADFNDFSNGPSGGYGAGNYNDIHRNRDDHYRYGDDSHFMQSHGYTGQYDHSTNDYRGDDNYSRSQPYSSNYDVAGNRRYARQENSYRNTGHGRRYSDYGRDEGYNYGHELTDIHHDRGDLDRDAEANNYRRNYNPRNEWDFDDNREDYRYSGRIEDSRPRRDSYATGLYSSNRAYVSDHSDSDGDRYSSRERRSGRSGPDYSAWSPIGGYGQQTFGL